MWQSGSRGIFVKEGANPQLNSGNLNPLSIAIKRNQPDILNALVKAGVPIDSQVLLKVVEQKDNEMVKIVLRHGVNLEYLNLQEAEKVCEYLSNNQQLLLEKNRCLVNPELNRLLCYAIIHSKDKFFTFLMDQAVHLEDPEPFRKFLNKESPLHLACHLNATDKIKALIKKGLGKFLCEDIDKKNPLQYLIDHGNQAIIDLLKEHSLIYSIQRKTGTLPFKATKALVEFRNVEDAWKTYKLLRDHHVKVQRPHLNDSSYYIYLSQDLWKSFLEGEVFPDEKIVSIPREAERKIYKIFPFKILKIETNCCVLNEYDVYFDAKYSVRDIQNSLTTHSNGYFPNLESCEVDNSIRISHNTLYRIYNEVEVLSKLKSPNKNDSRLKNVDV